MTLQSLLATDELDVLDWHWNSNCYILILPFSTFLEGEANVLAFELGIILAN